MVSDKRPVAVGVPEAIQAVGFRRTMHPTHPTKCIGASFSGPVLLYELTPNDVIPMNMLARRMMNARWYFFRTFRNPLNVRLMSITQSLEIVDFEAYVRASSLGQIIVTETRISSVGKSSITMDYHLCSKSAVCSCTCGCSQAPGHKANDEQSLFAIGQVVMVCVSISTLASTPFPESFRSEVLAFPYPHHPFPVVPRSFLPHSPTPMLRCPLTPVHSDQDHNDHVNNTIYIRMFEDSLIRLCDPLHATKVTVKYITETKAGDSCELRVYEVCANTYVAELVRISKDFSVSVVCKSQWTLKPNSTSIQARL